MKSVGHREGMVDLFWSWLGFLEAASDGLCSNTFSICCLLSYFCGSSPSPSLLSLASSCLPQHLSSYSLQAAQAAGLLPPSTVRPVTQREIKAETDEAPSIRRSRECPSACLGRAFCSESLFGPEVAALVCFTALSISLWLFTPLRGLSFQKSLIS